MFKEIDTMQRYQTRDAVAAAIYAFDTNGSVIKENTFRKDADSPTGLCEVFTNKSIISQCMANPEPLQDIHYTRADDVITYIQQAVVMQTLTKGSVNDFVSKMHDVLNQPEITARDFAYIAWAPKLAVDYENSQRVKNTMSLYESTSRFVGNVGNKITVNFTLINSRHHQDHNSYAVVGHDDNGNIIMYWANREDKVIRSGKLTGKVKAHQTGANRNKRTILNYVKIVKDANE
jgi:hypothetical protein